MDRRYFVYILASRRNSTLYIGMTNNLTKRVHEHREGLIPGFTKSYGVKMLVHYEVFEIVWDAIRRKKRLKKWKREWKIDQSDPADEPRMGRFVPERGRRVVTKLGGPQSRAMTN